MKKVKAFAAGAASLLVAAKSFGSSVSYTMSLVAGTNTGELAPFDPSAGTNGPTTMAAINNATVLQAAINYANKNYFLDGGGADTTNTVTIVLPQGAFAFAPYSGHPDSYVEFGGMTQMVHLPNMPKSMGAPAGVIDVSGYNPVQSLHDFAPLGNLVASIPPSSTLGHLTITGAGDCVNLSNPAVPIIGDLGCPSGTAIYTIDGVPAIYGDQTNHVTFSELGFDRASEYVSQGTITNSTKSSLSMSGTFTPGTATLTISTGYPGADILYGYSYNMILDNLMPPESRYLRVYSAPTPGNPAMVLAMDGSSPNSEVGWSEPDDMQPSIPGGHTQTVGCMAGGGGLYTPAIPGTQTMVGGSLTACQVAPLCVPANSVSSVCTLYLDGDGAPALSMGDFVCIKAKYLNSEAYNFYGPWKDLNTSGAPQNYGGTDVMFSNVSWVQQTVGNTYKGFTDFTIENGYLLRAQPPPGTGVQAPCLASSSGGPQLGGYSSDIVFPDNWPIVANTINGLYAIATGDDSVALFSPAGITNITTR
jgi:hypothetical protein